MSDMRPTLLPGLIAAAQRNADRGNGDVALFEVSGTCSEGDAPEKQRRVAAGVRRGTAKLDGAGRHWAGNAASRSACSTPRPTRSRCSTPSARRSTSCRSRPAGRTPGIIPGRSGTIKLGPKTVLGWFGEFHPTTLEALDVSGPLAGFEVFLDTVPEPKAKPTRTKPKLDLSAVPAGDARLRLRRRPDGRGRRR